MALFFSSLEFDNARYVYYLYVKVHKTHNKRVKQLRTFKRWSSTGEAYNAAAVAVKSVTYARVDGTRCHQQHKICLTKPAYDVNLLIPRLGIDDAWQVPQYKVAVAGYNNKTIIGRVLGRQENKKPVRTGLRLVFVLEFA